MSGAPAAFPSDYDLLASVVAGRTTTVGVDPNVTAVRYDGRSLWLPPAMGTADTRSAVILGAALVRAGSYGSEVLRALVGQPARTRRYIALEVARVLRDEPLLRQLHWIPPNVPTSIPSSETARDSLRLSRSASFDPLDDPRICGIRPSHILAQRRRAPTHGGDATRPPTNGPMPHSMPAPEPSADEAANDEEEAEPAPGLLRAFTNGTNWAGSLANMMRSLLGSSRGDPTQRCAGGAGSITGSLQVPWASTSWSQASQSALSTSTSDQQGPTVGRWLYPEWDDAAQRLRPERCAVHQVPADLVSVDSSLPAPPVPDTRLARSAAALGRGLVTARRQTQGDDIDLDGVIRLAADRAAGHCADDNPRPYLAKRRTAADLQVMILLDISGSAGQRIFADGSARTIHQRQLEAAHAVVDALHDAGHCVGVMAFHSQGRQLGRAVMVKTFGASWTGRDRLRLASLRASGYSRLGLGIRHATRTLAPQGQCDVARRLLIVMSDARPFDIGYEGAHGVADTLHAVGGAIDASCGVLWIIQADVDDEVRVGLEHLGVIVLHSAQAIPDALQFYDAAKRALVKRPARPARATVERSNRTRAR